MSATEVDSFLQTSPDIRQVKQDAISAFLAKRMEDAAMYVTQQLADPALRMEILPMVQQGRAAPDTTTNSNGSNSTTATNGDNTADSGGDNDILNDEQFRKDCSDLVASIVEIYERDFVTLCHGKRGAVFGGPHPAAIRFLLTGLGLAILYDAVPRKADALERLSHEALIVISARDTWIRALQSFGTVPTDCLIQQQREVAKRSRTVRLNKKDASSNLRERSPSAMRLAATEREAAARRAVAEARLCPECHRPLAEQPPHAALIRCAHCGAQIVRYFVAFEDARCVAANSPQVDGSEQIRTRTRTVSV